MLDVLQRTLTEIENLLRENRDEDEEPDLIEETLSEDPPLPHGSSPNVTPELLREADEQWEAARERGRLFRDEARSAVGPLITPQQAARRLGVSKATLATWRSQNKLLGVRFDDHQYLYPTFQFVDSPELGDRGVLHYLDAAIAELGSKSPWWKARFFLSPSPRLRGKTPLEILRAPNVTQQDVDLVLSAAKHFGEMGG
jgi:hypothetical protein